MNARALTLLRGAADAFRTGRNGDAIADARALVHEMEASTDPLDADLVVLLKGLFGIR